MTTDPAVPELRDPPVVVADDRTAAAVATRMRLALVLQRGAGVVVLVAVLIGGSVAFGSSFASAQNLLNIALASSFLAIVAVGHDVRDHQRRHRPVGRLGAGAVRRPHRVRVAAGARSRPSPCRSPSAD